MRQGSRMTVFAPLAALFLLQGALGAEKSVKTPTPPKASGQKVLLDAWYTVKLKGKIPYGYYNDHAEMRGNRLFFQNHFWKKEEDYINEEQLGAYAEPNVELTPLFFNFHLTYRSSETTVDGTVTEGRKFSARVRKGSEELPIIKRTLPEHTIFAGFFPVWLHMRSKAMKVGESASFKAIPEDSWEQDFKPEPCQVRAEKPDEFATRSGTRRFSIEYRDMKSYWWVDDKGEITKIDMPESNALIERVKGEEEARKFLE